jgi:hypothetical protein
VSFRIHGSDKRSNIFELIGCSIVSRHHHKYRYICYSFLNFQHSVYCPKPLQAQAAAYCGGKIMTQDIVYPAIEEKPGLVSNDNSQNPQQQQQQQQIHQHGEKKQQCFEMDSWHKNFLELKEIIRQEQIHRWHDNKKGQEEEDDDDDDDDDDDSMQLIAEIRQKGSSSDETLESSSKSAMNMQHDTKQFTQRDIIQNITDNVPLLFASLWKDFKGQILKLQNGFPSKKPVPRNGRQALTPV